MKLGRVVVGVDGSKPSADALAWAVGLAEPFDAEVIAVHGVGMLAQLGPERVVPAVSHRVELEAAFGEWTRPLEVVRHRSVMADGEPAHVILEVASAEGADLIVVGSRGMGRAPAQLLGSTAHHVAQLADRPVLIVTHADRVGE